MIFKIIIENKIVFFFFNGCEKVNGVYYNGINSDVLRNRQLLEER